jgi:hypothetical protein
MAIEGLVQSLRDVSYLGGVLVFAVVATGAVCWLVTALFGGPRR